MKIRTQLIFTLCLFGLILIGMATSLILTNQQVNRLRQQEEIAYRIEQGANRLGHLSGDYLMYGESQQRLRWEASFASFSADIARLVPGNPEQEAIVAHIRADQARLRAIFTDVVSTLEESARSRGGAPGAAFNQVSWSRMEVQNQSIAFEASLLSQRLHDQANRWRQMNFVLIFILIGIFGLYLLITYYLVYRRTLKSIAELHAGTEIIGSGDLDFTIAVKRADEIGELSSAFNQMTASLKEVTASKADLEREIDERERAEEALHEANEQLQEQAVELEMQANELRAQTEELEVQTEELRERTNELHFANEQLRLSEQRYSTIFEKSPFAMSLTKMPEGITVGVNNAFLNLFEYPRAEVIGKTSVDMGIADPDSRAQVAAKLQTRGSVQDFECVRTMKSGNQRSLSLNLDWVSIDGEKHVLTTLRDITEHKRLEQHIAARTQELEAANQELQAARSAALNLMEDALNAQKELEKVNAMLRESEQRLSRAQEIAHLGSWELDLVHNQLTWSDEVYRIFGLEPQEFGATYEAFLEAVHLDDRHAVDAAYSNSIREGKDEYEIEHRVVRRSNGEIRSVHEKCEHFRDENGQIVRSVGMVHDITEHKQAGEALRLSEEKFRSAFANASIGFAMTLPDGRFLDANPAYCALTGYDTEELQTMEFPSLIHPDDRIENMKLIAQMLEEQIAGFVVENRYVRKDGQAVWVRKSVSLVCNADHAPQWIVALVEDITARKQAQEALRKAHDELELRVQERTKELAVKNKELVREIAERKEVERQLRIQTTAMESAANGIVITDCQGNIQWTNPALTQITGYAADELVGRRTSIFKSSLHDTAYYRQLWSTILSGQVWRGEITNRSKDGSLYMEEQTITPVRDENNQIQHFIAIKQDITERKRAEAELEQWNIRLQALSIAEREQRQLSESLAEAALILNKSMKLDEVLALILEQVKAVIPYQLAMITMLDGESFYNASHAGDQRWSNTLSQVTNRFPLLDFPLLMKMRQSHQPVLISDTQKEPDWMIVHGLEWSRSFLCVPLLAENQVIGFLNLFAEQTDFFTTEMRDRLAVFASHAAVAIQNAWLFEQVRASNERLQSLSHRLVEIQENERLYIARELHDEAGQMLTSLMLDLVTLETQADQPEAILKKVAQMEESLSAVSENLHGVAMALRPASLDHLGLVPALRQYLESVGERYRLKVSFSSGNFQERLPASMETELYRIVQEALTNVARHACALQVDVILTVREDKLIVIVEDDGKGFDPENIPDTGHLGLFGMRERAEMIGGKLVIESTPGKGTTIMVEVDYDSSIVDRR